MPIANSAATCASFDHGSFYSISVIADSSIILTACIHKLRSLGGRLEL